MDVDLTGEVAVVTGACGRLGPVWRDALLDAGAAVFGLDVTGSGAPPGRSGDRYVHGIADVTDRSSLRDALARCRDRLGEPTILVNNAGVDQPPGASTGSWLIGDVPDELSARVLDVNALGTLRVCQVFGSAMAERRRGAIVNVGSLYGTVGPDPRLYEHIDLDPPFLKPPAYGMSKAAVSALTRYLAVLWGPNGVRVNTLSPGGVRGAQDEQFIAKFQARVPLGRMAASDDLTGPLIFLASAQSAYVTGIELLVDGGYVCW